MKPENKKTIEEALKSIDESSKNMWYEGEHREDECFDFFKEEQNISNNTNKIRDILSIAKPKE
ncbi:hypothetical protein [Winogradskyella pulchriflava]|uniref:Uncharacterized protein n=1 Tax=Winogradskyella pulchriflava TaxID=1110688 RepID=A0ABV6QCA0_9FLAO